MEQMEMLKEKMSLTGLSTDALAQKMDIDPSTLYRKMKRGCSSFTVGEMHRLVDVLNLTAEEAQAIFLS